MYAVMWSVLYVSILRHREACFSLGVYACMYDSGECESALRAGKGQISMYDMYSGGGVPRALPTCGM